MLTPRKHDPLQFTLVFLAFIHPPKGLVVVNPTVGYFQDQNNFQSAVWAYRARSEIRRDSEVVVSSRNPGFTAAEMQIRLPVTIGERKDGTSSLAAMVTDISCISLPAP